MYKVSGFLFPDNFSSSKKTSFLLDVLSVFNFYSDETLIAKRSSASMYLFYLYFIVLRVVQVLSTVLHQWLKSIPFLTFSRDHLRSKLGNICGRGSFAVHFGDYLQSGDHLRSGIICGTAHESRHFVSVKFWSFYLNWRKILAHFNMIKKLYLENKYERKFFDRTFYLCLL